MQLTTFSKPTTQIRVVSLQDPVNRIFRPWFTQKIQNYKKCGFPVYTWILLHTISSHNGDVTHFAPLPYLRMRKYNFLRKKWKRKRRYYNLFFSWKINHLLVFKPIFVWIYNFRSFVKMTTSDFSLFCSKVEENLLVYFLFVCRLIMLVMVKIVFFYI